MLDHSELCVRAEKWLKSKGCGVTFREGFRAITTTGEQPDAIGWRDGISILIECKVSRSDYLADRKKKFRVEPVLGMGDWRLFLCAPGVIRQEDLPDGWGLIYAREKRIEAVHGIPKGNCNWRNSPFTGNKECEIQLMYSALRRITIRGGIGQIYEGFDSRAQAHHAGGKPEEHEPLCAEDGQL